MSIIAVVDQVWAKLDYTPRTALEVNELCDEEHSRMSATVTALEHLVRVGLVIKSTRGITSVYYKVDL